LRGRRDPLTLKKEKTMSNAAQSALPAVTVAPEAPATPSHLYNPERLRALIAPGVAARRNKNLLLYIHVPFCSSKCHFCDWVVGYSKADLLDTGELRARYVDALCEQISQYAPMLAGLGYKVTNLYWGGGTPTRLAPEQMARIHDTLAAGIDLSGLVEYTAECSPETVSAAHLDVLMSRGLNRISAGAQSFDPQIVRRMGRAHSPAHIGRAVGLFKDAGLKNFNLDLIVGFPGQTREVVLDSIQQALDAGVPHLSLYMFREFSTGLVVVRQMNAGGVTQDTVEVRSSIYYDAKAMLEAAGYEEYVVGYFAKCPDYYFHSEDYYFALRGDYFGFGAGAASVLGHCAIKYGEADRYGNSDVRRFIDDPVSLAAGPLKRMPDKVFTDGYFKAFATREGINFERWQDQFGFDFRALRDARPGLRDWFTQRESHGAVFVEDGKGVALSEETLIPTMIWRR
jgi:oxygen-independent coproporphyrinogen-3 oxidase